MAKFQLYRVRADGQLVVNLQSELIDHIDTRLVAPLMPANTVNNIVSRLNPRILLPTGEMVLLAHLASALKVRELELVDDGGSLDADIISAAVDMLLFGF